MEIFLHGGHKKIKILFPINNTYATQPDWYGTRWLWATGL